jgi:signal transduction histidine kinase
MASDQKDTYQPQSGEFRFQVDSGLLLQLGEELVSKPWVALAELVKNSYDADATYAIVEFKNVTKPGGEITIVDNGSGIPFDRLSQTWMRIATNDKLLNPVSPTYNRPRAGAKGIGRFAARRLAKKLELESVVETDRGRPREKTIVHFDWDAFRAGMDVQSVPVAYERSEVGPEVATGLTLTMTGARDAWTVEGMREAQLQVLRVVNPLFGPVYTRASGRRKDPGFSVQFDAPEFSKVEGKIDEEFLKSAVALLEGKVSKGGKATYKVSFRRRVEETEGVVYTWSTREGLFPSGTGVHFLVHYFPFAREEYEGLNFGLSDARDVGREFGGVTVRLDQFRVPPYGDRGDDWLKLDRDRARRLGDAPASLGDEAEGLERPLLLMPGNQQLFGQVQISREGHPQFTIAADREGFVENAAFEELQGFVRLGIDWLTVQYARRTASRRALRRAGRRARQKTAAELIAEARALLDVLSKKVGSEQTREAIHALDVAEQALAEQEQDRIGEIQMLRVLASTGTMLTVLIHELRGVLTGLRAKSNKMVRLTERLPEQYKRPFEKELGALRTWLDDTRQLADLLGKLAGADARTKRLAHNVRDTVNDVVDGFASYARDHHINVENGVPSEVISPPMYRCELGAILLNLLTNAFKAVLWTGKKDISVTGRELRGNLVLRVMDTGAGASPAKWEDYFEAFVSESEPDPELGLGTGMGLKIVRDLVELYGGDAHFVQPDDGWSTAVEVRLPYGH